MQPRRADASPPERRSRAGMPSRDRGRRAKKNGDRRAAVAEVRFVDAGRPEGRQTKARHRRVAGWRPGEGREGWLSCCQSFRKIDISRLIQKPHTAVFLSIRKILHAFRTFYFQGK